MFFKKHTLKGLTKLRRNDNYSIAVAMLDEVETDLGKMMGTKFCYLLFKGTMCLGFVPMKPNNIIQIVPFIVPDYLESPAPRKSDYLELQRELKKYGYELRAPVLDVESELKRLVAVKDER